MHSAHHRHRPIAPESRRSLTRQPRQLPAFGETRMTAIGQRLEIVRTPQVANAGRYQLIAKREMSAVIDLVRGIATRDFLHAAE